MPTKRVAVGAVVMVVIGVVPFANRVVVSFGAVLAIWPAETVIVDE